MFKAIYLNELKKNLKSISFYIFTTIMFSVTMAFVLNTDPNTGVVMTIGKECHNAPLVIARYLTFMSVYSILITMIMAGRTVVKDFETRIHDFFFTLPITKTDYLGGRLLGGLTANLLIFAGVILGFTSGSPFLEAKFSGPFSFSVFFLPVIFVLIPNLLLIGSIFFSLATLTRKMVLTYISGILLLILYGFVSVGLIFLKNDIVKILADPFAISSLHTITKFWTVAEINSNPMPLSGLFLLNRLIWLSVTFIILYFTWNKFAFVSLIENKKQSSLSEKEVQHLAFFKRQTLNHILSEYSFDSRLKQCAHLVFREFRRIAWHPAFLVLTAMSMLNIFANFYLNVDFGGNNMYPLTSWFLEQVQTIWFYSIPLIIFFGGVIVWRERDNNSHQFYDTLPLPDWMAYLSKLFTLLSIIVFFLLMITLTGIVSQVIILGWTDIELPLYFKYLFGIEFLYHGTVAVLVLFLLNLANNKYLGYFLCGAVFFIDILIFLVYDWDFLLLHYGRVPAFIYSNMNGFGHFTEIIVWHSLYWLFAAAIISILTSLIWRRNEETALKIRLHSAIQDLNRLPKFASLSFFLLFMITGSYIVYNKYFLNDYLSDYGYRKMRADYEKNYTKYRHVGQPALQHVDLQVDLYPEKRDVLIKGYYILKNKSAQPIDSIFVNLSERRITQINYLDFDRPAALVYKGKEFGFRIFRLEKPLFPNEEIRLRFDLESCTVGFSDNNPQNELAFNGTCLGLPGWSGNDYFPLVGFNDDYLHLGSDARKEFGLSPGEALPTLEEADKNPLPNDHPFITYDATISTNGSQSVISNGELVDKWIQNDRNYFKYKSSALMQCCIQIVSGKYEVAADKQDDVNIEVYYHKKHYWNIKRIIKGVKRSLDYCSHYFCEYPYSTFRVVEIPDYLTPGGAWSQPSLVVWRESIGFTSNVDDAEGIDQLFGITAHEVTHNWWPDIIVPAQAEGMEMFSEFIAEYVRIMCVEKEYGKDMARRHLKREMQEYLGRRRRDVEGERPLMRAHPQQYFLSYQKSAFTIYALQDYIGEQNVNYALKSLVEQYGFHEDISPTSLDMVSAFRAVTPDSLQYIISDLFEKITLHENEAIAASYKQININEYKVKLKVASHKFYADSIGNQTSAPLNDYIYIAVFGENGKELYYKKHKFTQAEAEYEITVNQKPFKAGIDPYMILVDRNRDNNMVSVKISQ
jgi:ABC-2 type transport system permease protein